MLSIRDYNRGRRMLRVMMEKLLKDEGFGYEGTHRTKEGHGGGNGERGRLKQRDTSQARGNDSKDNGFNNAIFSNS